MVYPGKPSTGCYLCRRRKIKCDETEPACRNCKVYGRDCPGYRPAIVFQNENQTAQQLVTRFRSLATRNAKRFQFPELSPSVRVTDSLLEDQALCYFFDQYSIPKKPLCTPGHMEYIPPLYAVSRERGDDVSSSCLRWAVDAAAFSSLANEANIPTLSRQAWKRYGMALRELKEALDAPGSPVKNETLAAIVLLTIFEDINGERKGLQSSHVAGFELLVRLRSEGQLANNYGRSLFNFAYTQMQIQILALGDRPRMDMDSLVGLFDHSHPTHLMMSTVSKISSFIWNVSSQLWSSRNTDLQTPMGESLPRLIESGKLLDSELTQWCQVIPIEWLPCMIHSATGETLITYRSVSVAILWNFYRSARSVILYALHRICQSLQSLATDSREQLITLSLQKLGGVSPEKSIRDLFGEICKSIPFSLGDIDIQGKPIFSSQRNSQLRAVQGYQLLWPLWHMTQCEFSSWEQRSQARAALQRLGSQFGIKLALVLANSIHNSQG